MGADLLVKCLIVLAIIASIGGGVVYLEHRGAAARQADIDAENSKNKAARVAMISGLALDLSKAHSDLAEERRVHRQDNDNLKEQYNAQVHNFVPRGEQCIRAGFVRFLDNAAAGVPAVPGSDSNRESQAATPIGADDAATVIARNYGLYRACVTERDDIIRSTDTLRAKFNDTVGRINAAVPQ